MENRFLRLIETLVRNEVRFIVVGGIANLKFDLLGTIDWGGGYDDLLASSEVLDVGGHPVRVLTLEKLTEIKRQLTRPKDKLMLVHLEAALDERRKARGGS